MLIQRGYNMRGLIRAWRKQILDLYYCIRLHHPAPNNKYYFRRSFVGRAPFRKERRSCSANPLMTMSLCVHSGEGGVQIARWILTEGLCVKYMHIKTEIYFKSVFKKNVKLQWGKKCSVVVFCSVLQFLCRKYSEHGTSKLFPFFKPISG